MQVNNTTIPLVAMPGISWANIVDRANLQIADNNYLQEKVKFIQRIYQILSSKKLQKSSSILDVSCGTGNYLVEFAKSGFNAIGIENDLELVADVVPKQKKEGVTTRVYWGKDDKKIDLIAGIQLITFFDTAFNRFFLNNNSIRTWLERFSRILGVPGVIVLQVMPSTFFADEKLLKMSDDIDNACDISLSSTYKLDNNSTFKNILTCSIKAGEVNLRTAKQIPMRFWDYREVEKVLHVFGFKSITTFDFKNDRFIAGLYNPINKL